VQRCDHRKVMKAERSGLIHRKAYSKPKAFICLGLACLQLHTTSQQT